MTVETSNTLGECLRNEREKRGITIEQVASATKINVRMLHALEADHFVELPAKPFVRGFVTSYCRFIGLSPREVLTRFNSFIEEKAHDRPNRDAGHSGYAFEKREGEQSRTVLWFVMGGFITVGGIVFIFLKPSLHRHHSSHLEKLQNSHSPGPSATLNPDNPTAAGAAIILASPSPAATTPSIASAFTVPSAIPSPTAAAVTPASPLPEVTVAATASAPTLTTASATPIPVASEKPPAAAAFQLDPEPATEKDPLSSGVTLNRDEIVHKTIFKAKNDVWVRYRVDGKPVMKFILRKDRVLVLRARKAIQFQTSDPKSIAFSYNGRGTLPMTSSKSAALSHERDLTLFFPSELMKIITEPFPGEKGITGRSVPAPRATPGLSTPTE